MGELISVVVPIYNIERYLGICIESILNQTYSDMEIILVDDGSTDRSRELCDLYAEKDIRIKVIHKTNGGLVSARKAGLRKAQGRYVAYVDGDDWIGPGFIESLYSTAVTSEADMVCAGFTRELFSKTVSFSDNLPIGLYEGDKLRYLYNNMISFGDFYRPGITTYVWNKLFKRDILYAAQIRVDDRITIGEDAAVTYPALMRCSKVALVDNVAYHYRQREDSMLKQRSDYWIDAQKLKYLYDYLNKWINTYALDDSFGRQIDEYVLSTAIMRSGGYLPQDEYMAFNKPYCDKSVIIYSAGTFGQQLVHRIMRNGYCKVVAWVDDDYWEYRRCCMDVDPVDTITKKAFDYILVAKVDRVEVEKIIRKIQDYGISRDRILTIEVSKEKKELIEKFLNYNEIKILEEKNKREVNSHA